jgi:hypothetical protein
MIARVDLFRSPVRSATMTRLLAMCALLIAGHGMLVHTLHLAHAPHADGVVAAHATHMRHTRLHLDTPADSQPDCSAPSFVTTRGDAPLGGMSFPVAACTSTAIAADVEPPLQACPAPLPRSPGPDRQALLQRFTL